MQRALASAWKATTPLLPDEARIPAPYVRKDGSSTGPAYDFCLPPRHAPLNLLPEARSVGLRIFQEEHIPWHAGVDGGPSNHLLSSQVQCVNALGQMVTDPERILRAFGTLLGIDRILPIETGRFLTFEYVGPDDYFRESRHGTRTRGANCTSVDAAFLHQALDGAKELILVEWKYTERYGARKPQAASDAVRWSRYGAALKAYNGPVRPDLVVFEDLLNEPFYQLMRQQLLAHELERSHAEGADRVRVVHVSPTQNEGYLRSVHAPGPRRLGSTVPEVWRELLTATGLARFQSLDSAAFCDPDITSVNYTARYGSADDASDFA